MWCSMTGNYDIDKKWKKCREYDVCLTYKTLSDPWRNAGFKSTSFPGWPKNDHHIRDGWYRFTGIGGDVLSDFCVPNSSGSNMSLSLGSCRGTPTSSIDGYLDTCHSSCSASSCGPNAHCNSTDGSCACDAGFSIPDDYLPTGNSYGCSRDDLKQSPDIMIPEACKFNATLDCTNKLLSQIDNITTEVFSPTEVKDVLEFLTAQQNSPPVEETSLEQRVSSFNEILGASEKVVSTLVKKTEANYSVSISLQTTGNAAVSFISYTNMSDSSLFGLTTDPMTVMMSTVVSATLSRTSNTSLTKPVNFTLRHTADLSPNESQSLSCVYWKVKEWVVDGCTLTKTNSSHTVCSCTHLSTFALIMQTHPQKTKAVLELINTVAVSVGMVCLVLSLLTFFLCRRNSRVTKTTRVNLCISLLLAHLLFLLTQSLLHYIKPHQVVCAVLAGVLQFLFLSAFVWMSIEAVLLFISVKNLSRLNQKSMLGWKRLTAVGYGIPLVVVGVSAGVMPGGYGSEKCWLRNDRNLVWSFLGPVCFMLVSNVILFSLIANSLRSSLTRLNSQVSQINQTRIVVFKTVVQFFILGCPWILGFFTSSSKILEVLFLFLNSQQGTFIFLIHCILNKEVRQEYRKLLYGFQPILTATTMTEVPNTRGGNRINQQNNMSANDYGLITYNITTKGDQCVFPFFNNGVSYTDCVNVQNSSKPWCSTTDNYTRDGQRGDCLDYDVCQSNKTLRDPWRNAEFNRSAFPGGPLDDGGLQEGWYRFAGIGGDSLVYRCLSLVVGEISYNCSGSSFSSADSAFYTCDVVMDTPKTLDCGGGLVMYYLVPTNGTYLTRHSSCSNLSCGVHAVCNPEDGGCCCDSRLPTPVGFLTTRESYTCRELIPPVTEDCMVHCSLECALNLLKQIQSSPAQVMSKTVVAEYLNEQMKCVRVLEPDEDPRVTGFYGDSVLNSTEKLLSGLVTWTWTYYSVSISLDAIEAEVFVVGPNASLTEIPRLNTSNAYLDIDLIGISQINNGYAAVAFISYTYLSNLLNPSIFNKPEGKDKNIVSNVVSVVLYNITIEKLPRSFNITLNQTQSNPIRSDLLSNHTSTGVQEVNPEGTLSCMNWQGTKWVQDVCEVISINSSHTVCSCDQPGTFALIMQINCSSKVPSSYLYMFNLVAVAVGLGFLGLTLLTFAVCRHHLKTNSVAQANLTLSLLLAQLLFLLSQKFLRKIRAFLWACKVLSGVLHYLFLSAFVWMLIDAVLLFISAKNLSKIRSSKEEVLGWKWLTVIGYVIPLVLVGVSAGVVPEGYGSEQCWIKMDRGFFWSFLGPVCVILACNLILFVAIVIMVIFTLKSLKSEILQRKNTLADKKVIQSVMLKTMAQFFILGCPWILGFFTCNSEVLEFLFLFFNSQQGTFIFLIHCILNKDVREQCKKWSRAFCPGKKNS
ncbi:uncharacterized protein LOC103027453 [Astyanax mexicanus]|uniref:uncharacterized protein LOC103027453 n=1 Tax=Astyanax mexicanus TaxID=7994 RepID=UPI0020CB11DC|nr:uncharacterized protein LOC103027453 [Astyanax mexicanus]